MVFAAIGSGHSLFVGTLIVSVRQMGKWVAIGETIAVEAGCVAHTGASKRLREATLGVVNTTLLACIMGSFDMHETDWRTGMDLSYFTFMVCCVVLR